MLRASIDIGSNSCLLLIGRVLNDGSIETLVSEARVTSLGKDLDKNKKFLEKSMDDTFLALKEYKEMLSTYDLSGKDVLISATEASRVATNADTFFSKIKSELNFSIVKISGEGEAYYTALGVSSGIRCASNSITIMDIGGASTELIRVNLNPFKILDSVSIPVGSVRASDWLELGSFDQNFNSLNVDNYQKYSTEKLICVAGTMTTLSAILSGQLNFSEKDIQGHSFSIEQLKLLSSKLSKKSPSEINSDHPFCGKRASSLFGGSLVAEKIASILKVKEIEISTLGLRYGVLKEGKIDERFTK